MQNGLNRIARFLFAFCILHLAFDLHFSAALVVPAAPVVLAALVVQVEPAELVARAAPVARTHRVVNEAVVAASVGAGLGRMQAAAG